jgi:predicted RNA-binding Zn ribbon-like protein
VTTLRASAQRAGVGLEFEPDGSRLEPQAGGVDGALGRLLVAVHEAQHDGTWARMKACPWDTCHWAFYDHTKNRSGVWCNMAVCGNRAKARAYRERHA